MLVDKEVRSYSIPVIFGDAGLLRRVAPLVRLRLPREVISLDHFQQSTVKEPTLVDIPCPDMGSVAPGRVSPACGAAAYRCLETAILEAMAGRVKAIATAPLNKEALALAGIHEPGHTEILARLTNSPRPCMMLASEKITTSLVTTHTSLASVPGKLSIEAILNVIRLTAETMERLRRKTPKLVVCGLNPRLIEPAIAQARAEGFLVEGPLPPDTAFLPDRMAQTSAYICMYHDQGLIPFKMLAFESGVNITLGLPITRTSPDHGTAFDIAWKGLAHSGSMRQAILYAVQLSR
jgi:4-hydroxythreonine-4-phosphate dehydrogenase